MSIYDTEDCSGSRMSIDSTPCVGYKFENFLFVDTLIIDNRDIHIGIDHTYSCCGSDIYHTRFIFGEYPYWWGRQTFLICDMSLLFTIYHYNTIVIGSDPYPSMTVLKQGSSASKAVSSVHFLKVFTIVSENSTVSACPDISITCSKYKISVRCRQTVIHIIDLWCISDTVDLTGKHISAAIFCLVYSIRILCHCCFVIWCT